MKKLLITIFVIMPTYMMFGQTTLFQEILNPPIVMTTSGEPDPNDPYYDDPEDILLERIFNGMAGPRSISLETVLANYTSQCITIFVEYYTGPVYVEVKSNGNTLIYDVCNILFEGEIIIPIDTLSPGMYQLVVRTGSTYTGYLLL